MRIQKYLSEKGICSRREAEAFIERGLVTVNGKVVREQGVQIDPDKDTILLLTGAEKVLQQKMSVVFNKPRGVVSSRLRQEGKTVYDLFPQLKPLNIIGRLDKESDGLLLLSNDGVIGKRVTGEAHAVEKEYEVRTREEINAYSVKPFTFGVALDGKQTLPAKVEVRDKHTFRIILKEGRRHQIRRMCEAVRLNVESLTRLRIGPIKLGSLPSGQYRQLTEEESAVLRG